ncbi:MAG: 3-isopropylmalate dehydratase small subunit [Leptospiraceae bacterium]|nr:3-isopropylmalate dehydratase small subunit [Leptospiraceae bacterium]
MNRKSEPNIGERPTEKAGPDSMAIRQVYGRPLPLPGNDIDTDQIIPARFMRALTFEGIEKHLFEDVRSRRKNQKHPHPLDDPHFSGGSILIVDDNFGCGSSREHAAQCLQRWGIQAIIGLSFAEIFHGNSVSVGMPCFVVSPEDHENLKRCVHNAPGERMVLDLECETLTFQDFQCPISMPAGMKRRFVNGSWNSLARLLEAPDRIQECARSLPYIQWTTTG